jgi:hypothetical protein
VFTQSKRPCYIFRTEPMKPHIRLTTHALPGYADENEWQYLVMPQKRLSRELKSQNISAAVIVLSALIGVAL